MHSRTVEQVRSWDSRPFSGGLDSLSALSASDHTGAVVAADTWLFMLNGRVVGVFEGTIEDFETEGTVYSTPHDGLVLLFAMQEREGQTRARYFTEDTSLAEADDTLSAANFTGYVVLSENVLSGDYYLVYYGGTRRSVAFVGQSERLETGEDAYELAAEEVGLYEVKDVSLTITEIPDPSPATAATEEPEPAVASTTGAEGAAAAATGTEGEEPAEPDTDADAPESAERGSEASAAEPSEPDASEPADATPSEPTAETSEDVETAGAAADTSSAGASSAETSSAEPSRSAPAGTESTPTPPSDEPETTGSTDRTTDRDSASGSGAGTTGGASADETSGRGDTPEPHESESGGSETESELKRRFRAEAEWRQTRAIPALDPDETEPTEASDGARSEGPDSEAATPGGKTTATGTASSRAAGDTPKTDESGAGRSKSTGSTSPSSTTTEGSAAPTRKLRAAVEKREKRIEELEARLSTVESERSELEADLEDERHRRTELESRIEDLEAERDRLREQVATLEGSEATGGGEHRQLRPEEALSGTNLFVRYGSKSDPTLEVLDEGVDPEAVNANLTLEHHTQFDAESVRVEGEDFRPFLESTGPFRFVDWVLRELPYELQETDNRSSLADLYGAIPEIDRIEFDGSVDGPEGEATFTVVMRNRMGEPLIVGEYHEGRNPVREGDLEALLSGAEGVAETAEELAGALFVTASFFEPDALELAESAAASGGLFSRQDKASYVSPETGGGFHLGLIEDRSETFHVTVPKL